MRRTRITAATLAAISALTVGGWALDTATVSSAPTALVIPVAATAPLGISVADPDPSTVRLHALEARLQTLVRRKDEAARAAGRAAQLAVGVARTPPAALIRPPTGAGPVLVTPTPSPSSSPPPVDPPPPAPTNAAPVPSAPAPPAPPAPAAPAATPPPVAYAPSAPATAPPAVSVAAAPATHTSTGASGSGAPTSAGTAAAADGHDGSADDQVKTGKHRQDKQDD